MGVSDDHSKSQQPASASLLKRLRAGREGLTKVLQDVWSKIPCRLLLGLLLAIYVLQWLDVFDLLPPPLRTHGSIYVDSPEVYTRERLVNDRYDQDWWLRKQMDLLDPLIIESKSGDFLQQRSATSGAITAGGTEAKLSGGASQISSSTSKSSESKPDLTFEQRLAIVRGIRDQLRQQILENMLDDRHDLTGNSIYGLKFDTTVIPGNNTHDRAFVEVALTHNNIFEKESVASQDTMPAHLRTFLDLKRERVHRRGGQIEWEPGEDWEKRKRNYEKQQKYYLEWLADLEERLNITASSLYRFMYGCRDHEQSITDRPGEDRDRFYPDLIGRTLHVVLGISKEEYQKDNRADSSLTPMSRPVIKLPRPWCDVMMLTVNSVSLSFDQSKRNCRDHIWFDVEQLTERFIARQHSQMWAAATAADAGEEMAEKDQLLGETLDWDWDLFVDPELDRIRRMMFSDPYRLAYRQLPSIFFEEYEEIDRADAETPPAAEPRAGLEVQLDSGLFNFVERMSESDAYSYAIFPKNDLVGVLEEVSAYLTGQSGAAKIELQKYLTESRAVSMMVGYGRILPEPSQDRAVRFGWVISPLGNMQPTLKSQLALVSVPAWIETLILDVTTGWIGAQGIPVTANRFETRINVPPDYEAFDSVFLRSAGVRRGPHIHEDRMDQQIDVIAGGSDPVSILIPGTRLWRSTTVTLGGQTADRIRVMPNMEGIVAEFSEGIDRPHCMRGNSLVSDPPQARSGAITGPSLVDRCQERLGTDRLEVKAIPLRVWTSEGVAEMSQPVCVIYDPGAENRAQTQEAALPDRNIPASIARPVPEDHSMVTPQLSRSWQ